MELLSLIIHNLLSFIFIISVMVFIHEGGHFLVARLCGVKVETFSIGFGPELYGWNDKSGTRWKLCAVPLGGYVKMFGDEGAASTPDKEKMKSLTPEEEKMAFHNKPLWAKAAIVSAGPIANFILAVIIFTFLFTMYGKRMTPSIVDTVDPGSAAAITGLQPGDRITEINGEKVSSFEEIINVVSIRPGIEMSITYIRNDQEIKGTITPQLVEDESVFKDKIKVGRIGIRTARTMEYVSTQSMPFPEAVAESVKENYRFCKMTLVALGQMITGKRSASELSGPLWMAKASGESVKLGFKMVLWLMALLSINLGLFNLFPIPMLDGGHLMFYIIEAISGKPVAEKVQEYAFRTGFALLIMLMLFATYNDLKRFKIIDSEENKPAQSGDKNDRKEENKD